MIGQPRNTQRYKTRPDELTEKIRPYVIAKAKEYGRYGYRKVTDLLRNEGWKIGKDRVYTIWRQEGLKIPGKQPKRGRLWFTDGSCIRHRPKYKNHVWSYDFVSDQTHDEKKFKILNVIDEYSRECVLSLVKRRINSQDVIFALADLCKRKGTPAHIRSDNGPEFIAKKLIAWLNKLEVKPLYIHPRSPWENGYCESFNGKMRFELLNGEIFYSLKEAQVLIERWRIHYNTVRPHMSLGGRPPVPETTAPRLDLLAM